MRCPRCDAETPNGAKFCIDCGTPLQHRRPQCGADTIPRAKFCAECGTPLTARSPEPPTAPPPSPRRYTPSAVLTIWLCNGVRQFARVGGTDWRPECWHGEHASGLHQGPLPMPPRGFQGMEPGTLAREPPDQETTTASACGWAMWAVIHSGTVGLTCPEAWSPRSLRARVPWAVKIGDEPRPKGACAPADGTSRPKVPPPLGRGRHLEASTGQGCAPWGLGRSRLVPQPHGLVVAPGLQGRRGCTAPPPVIVAAEHQGRRLGGHREQAGPAVFFRSSAGSGLTSQGWARGPLPPKRPRASSRVGAERGVSLTPCSGQTAARRLRGPLRAGGPKVWGLWCTMPRTCSRGAAFSTGSPLSGRFAPCGPPARPWALHAWSTGRTVCGAQRQVFEIPEGGCRSALARTIWQRRTVKASCLRRPAVRAARSSSGTGQIDRGGFLVQSRAPWTLLAQILY
jgi:Double zinc ribbon